MKTIETIPDYLERMALKDRSKGYESGGLRTTSEIAEYFSLTPTRARRILERLADRDLITSHGRCEFSPGRPYLWGPYTSDGDDDPDGGLPVPSNDNMILAQAL